MTCPRCACAHVRAFDTPPDCWPVYVCNQRRGGCGLVFAPKQERAILTA